MVSAIFRHFDTIEEAHDIGNIHPKQIHTSTNIS